jgi:hypothetical protein
VSRIPAILCQTLSIPCAANLFTLAEVSPGNWRELPQDADIASLGWHDGQRVIVKPLPTELQLVVHVGKLSPNPRTLRLPRTARIREICERLHVKAPFVYGWDAKAQVYIPLALTAAVSQIDEHLRESLIISSESIAKLICVKCVKVPGKERAEIDCDVAMSVKQLAMMFVFGIVEEPDAKFEVWREANPGQKLKMEAKLTEAGIRDGDTVLVKVTSISEEKKAEELAGALRFWLMRPTRTAGKWA